MWSCCKCCGAAWCWEQEGSAGRTLKLCRPSTRCCQAAATQRQSKAKEKCVSEAAAAVNGDGRASSALRDTVNLLTDKIQSRGEDWLDTAAPSPAALLSCFRQRTGRHCAPLHLDLSAWRVLNFCALFMSCLKVEMSAFNQMRLRNYGTGNSQDT